MSKTVVGLFVHTLQDDCQGIKNQGRVIGRHDGDVLVELFSFMDGAASNVIRIPDAELFDSSKCRLYDDETAWVRAYLVDCQHNGVLSGTVEENIAVHFRLKGLQ